MTMTSGSRCYFFRKHFAGVRYVTVELNQERAKFGSRTEHIIGIVQQIGDYLEDGSMELVVLNGELSHLTHCHSTDPQLALSGVVGWGVNTFEDLESTMTVLHRVLKRGGVLILGWNHRNERNPGAQQERDTPLTG